MIYSGGVMTLWAQELDNIQKLMDEGLNLEEIGKKYDVSKQRIYQVLTKYGVSTPCRLKRNFLRDKGPEFYWLNRMLRDKGFSKQERRELLETVNLPEFCPMLGLKLNYDGVDTQRWGRTDNSPSIDRINSTQEYTKDNIQVISWRANRIKNDSTPEELMRIAQYMQELTK